MSLSKFIQLGQSKNGSIPWFSELSLLFFSSKSGSDGLLKLWTIKTNECVKTLDGHEDKIWGLHSNKQDDMVVTASSDSSITLWKVQCRICFPLWVSDQNTVAEIRIPVVCFSLLQHDTLSLFSSTWDCISEAYLWFVWCVLGCFFDHTEFS